MAERWIFTKEQLQNTPSRKCGVDYAKELGYRQQAANLIQDMGQRLQVNQLCINTAIVYMHRFYMFQSFARFHRTAIAPACLFLAAKVEEQLRKLEHVIKVARTCLHKDQPTLDTKSEAYLELAQELVVNENILLQSLGFDIQVDHPHTHVVKTCQLVRAFQRNMSDHGTDICMKYLASKDLAQTSYFLATNSLHLTTMCLQYKPTVVACVCIHIASNWSEYEIAVSHEGKQWHSYVDKSVTPELLTGLTQEFLNILETCPLKLKRKILTWKSGNRTDEEGGPIEKRHKGESSGARLSGSHDKHAGESSKHDKRSESAAKSRRSETVTSLTETKPPAVESPSLRQVHTPPVPNPVRKSAVLDVASSRSGQSLPQSLPQSSTSAESADSQKKQSDLQVKPIPFRDYKSYREHKEKQAAAAAAGTGVAPTGSVSQEGERRLHGTSSSSDLHKKRKQSSSSSGDEKKIKKEREYERKHASHTQESGRHEEPLKLHIKKERTDDSLKVHIKKESGTHKIKPTGSPLKLTIKMNESSPSKSHEKSEHRQESLKMKLSFKAGQLSSHVERPSKHRRSESYSSHAVTNPDQGKHGYPSSRASTGVDGNGVHNPSQRNVNSHYKNAGHEGKSLPSASQQPDLSYMTERGASGSIFSPPPAPQNFDTNMFNTGAMLSQTGSGHRGTTNVNTSGYGAYHQQSNQSSNFNDSFSSFLPDMFNLGDTGPPIHGLETNGGSMKTQAIGMPTKEDLQQMETNMQQIIGRTKQIAQQQRLHQQQHNQVQARYGYIGMQAYQSNPPLPSVPPPPPPPPEDPPQPPPPPPTN